MRPEIVRVKRRPGRAYICALHDVPSTKAVRPEWFECDFRSRSVQLFYRKALFGADAACATPESSVSAAIDAKLLEIMTIPQIDAPHPKNITLDFRAISIRA
jgi:hypothetical protein